MHGVFRTLSLFQLLAWPCLDENFRAKEGGKEKTGHGALRVVNSLCAKNEASEKEAVPGLSSPSLELSLFPRPLF